MNFQLRSYEKERMDAPDLHPSEFHNNLKEIVLINRYLGGASVTVQGIDELIKASDLKSVHITDIGSGAGDIFPYLDKKLNRYKPSFTAVDIQPEAQTYMEKHYPDYKNRVNWLIDDYNKVFEEENATDIVTASLFCHHLNDEELVDFLRGAIRYARIGVVINDLHRHPFAYHSIRLLTKWFSNSEFTKHDAPLSVRRGFTASEWTEHLAASDITNASIVWKWAFRHLVVIPTKAQSQ
jgi:2-polyprenyl-3-methyl-5-hydroxy-6-metoxy-1,4-benzoquinol methylase